MKDEMNVKKKKGLNLLLKIVLVVTVPLIILVVMAGLALETVGSSTADRTMENELRTTVYAVEQAAALVSDGDFRLQTENYIKVTIICLPIRHFWIRSRLIRV